MAIEIEAEKSKIVEAKERRKETGKKKREDEKIKNKMKK